jgi:hypothetical protein
MRSLTMRALMTAMLALPAACVTINVYCPEAAAEKAAEQFVGKIIDSDAAPQPAPETKPPGDSPGAMLLDFLVPSASAQQANIDIQTPQIQAIQSRMRQRFSGSLSRYFASGAWKQK